MQVIWKIDHLRAITMMVLVMGLHGQAGAASCAVSVMPVAFGTYQPLLGVTARSTGTINVDCTPGLQSLLLSYTIALSSGSGGAYNARSLSGRGGKLAYQLYRDALLSQIWGDGTAGTVVVNDAYLLGGLLSISRSYTVYGSLGPQQQAGTGTYSDTVMVVLSY